MQVRTVTRDFIFSDECTLEMLMEIATHGDYLGQSPAWVEKLAKQQLSKGSTGNGHPRRNGSGELPYAKLRTVIVQKLQDSPTQGAVFKDGNMQVEFPFLPDLDIGKAGAQRASRGASATLVGPYVVVKRGVKCTPETDASKYEIWQHVWACKSFEEYFAKAPKKGVTKTGRIITAASEMRWAVKCGWIKPVA
jgi:hypothetical protein